jgi:hypothetical protein
MTVPGEEAETYLHEEMVSIKTIAGAVRIWKDAGEVRWITQQIQEQNEAGIDELRKLYAHLKGSARVQGVCFEDWLQPLTHQTFLPDEKTAPEPHDDSPLLSGPESSGADEEEMPPQPIPPTKPSPKRETQRRATPSPEKRKSVLQRRKIVVSDEESEGTPLQDHRKARKEQPQPQPFTTMLGLENPAQRAGCDPALLKRMRESGVLGEEGNQPVWDDVDMPPADPDLNFSFGNPAARAAGEK